ncbi:hypothetical protein Q5P01_008483 [Channa striata]|uniref:C2H2-type domain-containing protein n=1 Tax=Channa striata TaxID=64152 RepID=A0AA88N568_CHASR|nr:hypothetical protein Q5P01_008483 [Channa striata]
MKPVGYQSMLSSVNGGHANPTLDRVLNTSNVMYNDKSGFASPDTSASKKPAVEHLRTKFYCFYCNSVSYSEAELNVHLKQHTAKYPFKCPYCGQGYMRRLCLVKHIDRLHSKEISQGPAKSGMTNNPHVPVFNALVSGRTADPSPPRPAVRVTVPTPSAPVVRLDKVEQRGKPLDTNVSNATNGNAERLSPLNGLIQQNRALTVSLPEEVTIPAGCLVELVEVKTVNGTKELKLRLVTQQENETVIKDTRTTGSQNTALAKPLSTTLHHPNTVTSVSTGMCTVNRRECETKVVNVERPAGATIPKNVPNQVNKEKTGLKRSSPEIIHLDCNTVIPNKVPKIILNPVKEGNTGIRILSREPGNLNVAVPTILSTRIGNRLTTTFHLDNIGTNVSQRAVDERKNLIPEHSKSIPPRRASDTKSISRDLSVPVPVKLEPGQLSPRNNTASKIIKEVVGLNQQNLKSASPSLSVLLAADAQVKLPTLSLCKDNAAANPSFPKLRTNEPSLVKTLSLSNNTNGKISALCQEVRANEKAGEGDMPEPEGFPVISSVFSLSQQSEEVQGSIQPLVMALRGIVMDKNNSSSSATRSHVSIINNTEQMKEEPASGPCAPVDTKSTSLTSNPLTEQTSDSIKVEVYDKGIQHPPALSHNQTHVKEETNSTLPNNNARSHCIALVSVKDVESPPKESLHVDASEDPLQQMSKSEQDILKFPTVSLKRVQVGVWKKSIKGLKLRISKYKTQVPIGSVSDCTVIDLMPLRVDQPVKSPSPNQPVVVLNHPKPRASIQGARSANVADTGASGVVPKCQILKMRLSKVMGQKYEVKGCTVRVLT